MQRFLLNKYIEIDGRVTIFLFCFSKKKKKPLLLIQIFSLTNMQSCFVMHVKNHMNNKYIYENEQPFGTTLRQLKLPCKM